MNTPEDYQSALRRWQEFHESSGLRVKDHGPDSKPSAHSP
jgi:hypothetical protein